jgi:hypothetical protein
MNTDSGWTANYGDFGAGSCETCHGPGGPGPNVMGDGLSATGSTGSPVKPYDDGTWGYNVNGHGANGTARDTPKDPDLVPYMYADAACTDCHDTNDPPTGAGRHNNGTLNSVELKQNPSENTAHLIPAKYMLPGTATNDWDVQLKFDTGCSGLPATGACHNTHRHGIGSTPVLRAVQFGDGSTVADGESIRYPIDSALSTKATTAERDFAPCIACHNPHGTSVSEPNKTTNRMLRDMWDTVDTLCVECHR